LLWGTEIGKRRKERGLGWKRRVEKGREWIMSCIVGTLSELVGGQKYVIQFVLIVLWYEGRLWHWRRIDGWKKVISRGNWNWKGIRRVRI